LVWAYEDANVRVTEGAHSCLGEEGKGVAQTIHYTVEHNRALRVPVSAKACASR
jgi:hypothetical protein